MNVHEGVFIEKGPFFTVKGPRALPKFHAHPPPPQHPSYRRVGSGTGAGQWKSLEEVPRRTSLAPIGSPFSVLCLIGAETEGLLDYQGRTGIISIVRWNLRPVIFGVDFLLMVSFGAQEDA